jgi:hypothetical protein
VESPPSLTMGGIGLPISKEFKYLGVVFDRGLAWNLHTRYVLKRYKTRINFMKSMAGTAWGSHPDNMLILYKGSVRSVLKYGCVCFSEMALTHFKKLERVQWRTLRISLGLMQSTHTGTVVFLTSTVDFLSKSSDTLRGRLQTLADLGIGKMMREFTSVQ